jgi:hypothetical protein
MTWLKLVGHHKNVVVAMSLRTLQKYSCTLGDPGQYKNVAVGKARRTLQK